MQSSVNPTRTLVVGLGATGMSCVRYLTAAGDSVRAVDSRATPPMLSAMQQHYPDTPLQLGEFVPEWFVDADRIVLSPGVSSAEPAILQARQHGIEVIGDVELFARAARAPIVAITGSNGKSTVTALLGAMGDADGLNTVVGGNIGTPVLDLLALPVPDLYVIELSSFQLETTFSLAPLAATILNVSMDHMDRYPDMAHYAAAKQRIWHNAGHIIINRDDSLCRDTIVTTTNTFGVDPPPGKSDYGMVGDWLMHGAERLLRVDELQLSGRHNAGNVLAALALAAAAGISQDTAIGAAKTFPGLPHRCERVGRWLGIEWINDSKGTNVGATMTALYGMSAPTILIAGGLGKGADFTPLATAISACAKHVVLFGRDAGAIDAVIPPRIARSRVATLDQAVDAAAAVAGSGDVVLFSPACSSFDMFDNYEQRGDQFRQTVVERFTCPA
ncbi:MAG: UDP-N-acetylmuramoyl-L-alanine--D-glutamate ligase [Gammaproteobacteria bacterium]|nr:UDP-N-acetylmuramoyl-L-alanine--D-glutamate ligase [Gammaproteobacteria bacterium]MDH3466099.1 UDP-N-acetylmuramoyl-L-alanine--D-glutamate ligase [Gammaproteobacteria bacterium]